LGSAVALGLQGFEFVSQPADDPLDLVRDLLSAEIRARLLSFFFERFADASGGLAAAPFPDKEVVEKRQCDGRLADVFKSPCQAPKFRSHFLDRCTRKLKDWKDFPDASGGRPGAGRTVCVDAFRVE
jgi:hypothetical protein